MASYRDVIGGLRIFARLDPKGEEAHGVCAEHDEIYSGHDFPPEKLSTEDAADLERFGWTWDAEIDGWRRYV